MKAVVFYESADDLAEKAPLHASEHRARWPGHHVWSDGRPGGSRLAA